MLELRNRIVGEQKPTITKSSASSISKTRVEATFVDLRTFKPPFLGHAGKWANLASLHLLTALWPLKKNWQPKFGTFARKGNHGPLVESVWKHSLVSCFLLHLFWITNGLCWELQFCTTTFILPFSFRTLSSVSFRVENCTPNWYYGFIHQNVTHRSWGKRFFHNRKFMILTWMD